MAAEKSSSTALYQASDEYRPLPIRPPAPTFGKGGSVRIGIHTSIAGDITGALEIAHGLGANALQIFSASPRTWSRGRSRITEVSARRFRKRRAELRLGPLAIHANYLINLGSPNPVLWAQSVEAFRQEIFRAVVLGADFLIVHPGSAVSGSKESAIAAVGEGLCRATGGVALGDLQILIENTAGQGSSLGCDLSELQQILTACPELRLGVCIDTAHLFAAGHDIRTRQGLERTLDRIDRSVGLGRVPVFHLNDSKAALGSHVDRHEHIGKGRIGRQAFAMLLNHPGLPGRAFLLETPVDHPGDDQRNVAMLWRLCRVVRGVTGASKRPGPAAREQKAPGRIPDSSKDLKA